MLARGSANGRATADSVGTGVEEGRGAVDMGVMSVEEAIARAVCGIGGVRLSISPRHPVSPTDTTTPAMRSLARFRLGFSVVGTDDKSLVTREKRMGIRRRERHKAGSCIPIC